MIGVFDSGFGGLTVHHALVQALPEHDFVYLGDNRNAPYGTRPPIEVLNLTCAGIERLFAEGCTVAILACNTASVVALRWIQQHWLPERHGRDRVRRNVLGIVVPTIEAATGIGWNETGNGGTTQYGTIAVFATHRTVESGTYPVEIRKRAPQVNVVQQACAELAGSIEAGVPRERLRAMVQQYVGEMLARLGHVPDCAILACTHYPLVADLFTEALPAGLKMIHQPDATAHALKLYLERHPEFDTPHRSRRVFLSTGLSPQALPLIEKFWGERLSFVQS